MDGLWERRMKSEGVVMELCHHLVGQSPLIKVGLIPLLSTQKNCQNLAAEPCRPQSLPRSQDCSSARIYLQAGGLEIYYPCCGFDKPANTRYFALRFPRV